MARESKRKIAGDLVGRWCKADAPMIVEEWRRSGLSLDDFAAELGVSARRLGRWAARVEAVPSHSGGGHEIGFHPVRVVGSARGPISTRDAIEVHLADGRRVRVPEGFAAEDLARVLAVLEGRVSC